jgi:ATP-dependent DNA helicase PIF1
MELTECQARCFEAFKTRRSLVITGPAGCGKSFLIHHIKEYAKEQQRTIAVTALTGAAAALIGGLTLHSWGGIGLAKGSSIELYENVRKKPQFRKRWQEVDILVIDEISMMDAELFNKLHGLAQQIRTGGVGLLFGGIQVVLCGDFCQLKPVCPGSEVKFCFESAVWQRHLTEDTYYLDKVMRQTDPLFQDLLATVRLGNITEAQRVLLDQRIITDDTEADLYVEMKDGTRQTIRATTLYPKRKNVEETNATELFKLINSGCRTQVYKCQDSCVKGSVSTSPTESQVEILDKCTCVPKEITLAVGAQVMLIKNLDFELGLVNGSRGVITDFTPGGPVVMFDNGSPMTMAPMEFEVESGGKTVLRRRQVPLMLAWALTIHKCQGATITNVITDLTGVFEEAQVYVTLSRACTIDGLFIKGILYNKIKCNPKVKAYYEALKSS